MIDAAAVSEQMLVLPERHAATRDDAAPGFSFAGAMSALEARAAQSLETFGGAPQQNATNSAAQKQETTKGATPTGQDVEQNPIQNVAKRESVEAAARATDAPRANAAASKNSLAAPTQAVIVAPTTTAQTGAIIAPQQTALPAQRVEAPILAKAEHTRPEAPKAPRAAAPTTPATSAQDFAKLVARRLDAGATAFELRLDPPAFGRVEAQLRLSDAGEATLSLKFENQSALDHFSHDESSLRTALADAGYELNGEHLAFLLADENELTVATENAAVTADHYEPQFLAPYSEGLVDLRA